MRPVVVNTFAIDASSYLVSVVALIFFSRFAQPHASFQITLPCCETATETEGTFSSSMKSRIAVRISEKRSSLLLRDVQSDRKRGRPTESRMTKNALGGFWIYDGRWAMRYDDRRGDAVDPIMAHLGRIGEVAPCGVPCITGKKYGR